MSQSLQNYYTYELIYGLFGQNCNNSGCHNNIDQAGNLDLQGDGSSLYQKKISVYNDLFFQKASNSASAEKNEYLVYPGDPYRSYLFRKINNGLASGLDLGPNEGDAMPSGQSPLNNKEIELIRQWILFGAPIDKTVIDPAIIIDYYDNGGFNPLTFAPAPPAEGEGFQIHAGPFFLPPSANKIIEHEYYSKYSDLLKEASEIVSIETHMSNYSHHVILNKYADNEAAQVPYGLRSNHDYSNTEFVSGTQYSNEWKLPEGSAFLWNESTELDVNIHFVNYSHDKTVACEAYINVYTQEKGISDNIMQSKLFSYQDLIIPNDGETYFFEEEIFAYNTYPINIWAIQGHTHSLGTDFHVYLMDEDQEKGKKIYDGGCPQGVTGCQFENFQYDHLPTALYQPYEVMGEHGGLIYEASYENNTDKEVRFGLKSTDEMMLFVMYYTIDSSEKLLIPVPVDSFTTSESISVFPNPATDQISFLLDKELSGAVDIRIYDTRGQLQFQEKRFLNSEPLNVSLEGIQGLLNSGLYLITVSDDQQLIAKEKLIIR
ncbi:MAG: T9SS type A sorting domain-containing protein [Chitinophagales bacterium]|nr:T9SS type A sorting domain-containing protein [Chitinophagales bacterium]